MKLFFLIVGSFFLFFAPNFASSDLIKQINERRSMVDELLLTRLVYESANGYLQANPSPPRPLSIDEKSLIEAENLDRKELFTKISNSDSSIASASDAGKQFSIRYFNRYKEGILREDPQTSKIIDRWPVVKQSAEEMLTNFFQEIDRQERQLRKQISP